MSRSILAITFAMTILLNGLVLANTVTITTSAEYAPGKIEPNSPATFVVNWDVITGPIRAASNGFRLFMSTTPDNSGEVAGNFAPVSIDSVTYDAVLSSYFDGGIFYTPFSFDGMDADTATVSGFGISVLIPAGTNLNVLSFTATPSVEGQYFCIDSTFYPPGGAWAWVGATTPVQWGGPYCYLVESLPCKKAPVFDLCPQGVSTQSHCESFVQVLGITDACGYPVTEEYKFRILSGPGKMVDSTGDLGTWEWSPGLSDVGIHTVTISASSPTNTDADSCSFDVVVTNAGASFVSGCEVMATCSQAAVTKTITAVSDDCDPIWYTIENITGLIGSDAVSIDSLTGEVTFQPDPTTCGHIVTTTVGATDGAITNTCDITFEVLCCSNLGFAIEKTHMSFQGGHEQVDVFQTQGSDIIGGFDFLIAYDASALSFQTAVEGDLYSACGWEYFTYRYGTTGNCNGGCPSGLIRVVGMAETNNGPNHPIFDCSLALNETFFTLDFLVTDNRTYECQYIPIQFIWLDCNDNLLSNQTGDTAFISQSVFSFEGTDITASLATFPTYGGAPQQCETSGGNGKPSPVRFVNYINGGVDIACADSIDFRGDLNLNGVAEEVADAVLFSNYFVYGVGAFSTNVEGQIAASDVNADGVPLSVGDLVYLIRVIVGDVLPIPKSVPVEVDIQIEESGILSVATELGAVAVLVEGEVVPELMAEEMTMRYAFDSELGATRILVYSMKKGMSFRGDFLRTNGKVLSFDMALYDGTPVRAKIQPTSCSLMQNYPNPFNPKTTIRFELPVMSTYELVIFNVSGQEVDRFEGYEIGAVEVEWDGSNIATGIYFYRLTVGDYSETRKMILLK